MVKYFRQVSDKVRKFFYYQRVVLYGYHLNQQHKYEPPPGMKVREATLKDIDNLYNDRINNDLKSIDWKLWKEKIGNGYWKGFVCIDGEFIVAQAFYSVEDIFFGGTRWVILSLPAGCAYGFKLFTRQDYRGKKLGQAITSFRLNKAIGEGINKFYTIINSNNVVSRHNEEKIGGYLIGSVIFLKCRYFNRIFLTPGILKEGISIKGIY